MKLNSIWQSKAEALLTSKSQLYNTVTNLRNLSFFKPHVKLSFLIIFNYILD